jgi:multidrug efflux pump subunit AcrB
VSVVWQYNGLTPEEMEGRIVTQFERALTANVVGIEHIESQSPPEHRRRARLLPPQRAGGSRALADRDAVPGAGPQHAAGHVSATGPQVRRRERADPAVGIEQRDAQGAGNFDLANNFIRTPLATVQGATVSYPFGGKNRQVMVDLDLENLYAKRLSPIDVSNALTLQNLICRRAPRSSRVQSIRFG